MIEKIVTWLTGKKLVDLDELEKNMEIMAHKRSEEIISNTKLLWQGEAFEKGKKWALSHKRTLITFKEFEEWFKFADYSSPEEREIIAGLTKHEDWPVFIQNLRRQALKLHYDARNLGDAQMIAVYHVIGNKIEDLIKFYGDAAKPQEEDDDIPESGFEPQ